MGKRVARRDDDGQKVPTLKAARLFLSRDDVMEQIQMSVARTIDPDRLVRVALTAMSRNPTLLECSQASWVLALQEAGSLGLEPTGVLGHAYLVPRWNKNTRSKEAQFQIGYRGLVELARRSGKVQDVTAHVVREGDDFEYALGLDPLLRHVPLLDSDRPVTHVYAVAFFKNGFKKFDVMTTEQVEKVRSISTAKDSGPWVSHWDEMAKKTVVRRLSKELPLSSTEQAAIAYDDAVEFGMGGGRVDLNRFVAGDAEQIPEPIPDEQRAADRTRGRIQELKQRLGSGEPPGGEEQEAEVSGDAEDRTMDGEPPEPTPYERAKAAYDFAWTQIARACRERGVDPPTRSAWQAEYMGKANSGHFNEEEYRKAIAMLEAGIGISYGDEPEPPKEPERNEPAEVPAPQNDLPF